MPGQQQQQQQGGGDNSMAPVWIIVLLFLTGYVFWHVGHKYIVSFVFHMNLIEAEVIQFFLGNSVLADEVYIMQTVNPAAVEWGQLNELTKAVGDFIRYPIVLLLIIFAVWIYFSNVTLRYRRSHSMKSLKEQEQQNWPAIIPAIDVDLIDQDISKGPWAMAMSPMEFARKYNLLRKDDALRDKSAPGFNLTAAIRRGDAKRVFTLQLGPYWEGFGRCPAHARALAAVFIARMNRDRAAATNILEVLDRTSKSGKPEYSVANSTLRKYQNKSNVQEIFHKNAYLLTVMASLLLASREDGVMPVSEFLWLKTVDRRLWYMLNCVGRQTPYVEVAGPFAHWKAEKSMGRKVLVPMIDEAIAALEIGVKEVQLSPQELQELKP